MNAYGWMDWRADNAGLEKLSLKIGRYQTAPISMAQKGFPLPVWPHRLIELSPLTAAAGPLEAGSTKVQTRPRQGQGT